MPSTFMGIEIARRGLAAHQQALQTTGHNIANADNEHYARQRVNLAAASPLYDPSLNRANGPGMIGQGVDVSSIERIRDHYIDDRIMDTAQGQSYWAAKERYLSQLEIIYNEPADQALRGSLDNFWSSWQELSQFPEEYSYREVVRTRAEELVHNIRYTYARLDELRGQADLEIRTSVNRLNNIASEIRDLNEKILKSETMGDRPNDLMDRRDQLMQELSSMANISVSRTDKDELIVYLGGEALVQGEVHNRILALSDPSNEGHATLRWEHSNDKIVPGAGSLSGLIEMRDKVIRENIDKVDLLALNIHDIVNEVHRDGFGLTKETNIDFFQMKSMSRNIMANVDLNLDGAIDSTAIFRVTGNNTLIPDRPIGIDGIITLHKNDADNTPVRISYRADETVEEVIRRINRSEAGVVAYIDHRDRLALKGNIAEDDSKNNFMIRHIEDSGEFLVGFAGILQNSGAAGAFDYRRVDEIGKLQSSGESLAFAPARHPAGVLDLSEEVKTNVGLIATASGKDVNGTGDIDRGAGMKDGRNALAIAQALRHRNSMVGSLNNPEEFYNALIGKLGVDSRAAKDKLESHELIMTNLEGMRQSTMGVNLDEEMSNMVKFQHAYNASAKILQVMNEMLDQIINRLG